MPLDARLGESEEGREVDEKAAFRLLRGVQSGTAADEFDHSTCFVSIWGQTYTNHNEERLIVFY